MVGRYMGAALEKVRHLPEWQDPAWLRQQRLCPISARRSLALHRPDDAAQLSEEPCWRESAPAAAARL